MKQVFWAQSMRVFFIISSGNYQEDYKIPPPRPLWRWMPGLPHRRPDEFEVVYLIYAWSACPWQSLRPRRVTHTESPRGRERPIKGSATYLPPCPTESGSQKTPPIGSGGFRRVWDGGLKVWSPSTWKVTTRWRNQGQSLAASLHHISGG